MDIEALIAEYIEPNPHRLGVQNARLKGYGVSVWALIAYLKHAAFGDVERVAADYEVPVEAIEAAKAYYLNYKAAIDARIAANSPEASDLRHAA